MEAELEDDSGVEAELVDDPWVEAGERLEVELEVNS